MSRAHFIRCGHPRSAENVKVYGGVPRCRTCDEARRQLSTVERHERILALYNAGHTAGQIAAAVNMTEAGVRTALARNGLSATPPCPLGGYAERAVKVAAQLAGANVKQLRSDWRAPKVLVYARWAVAAALKNRGASLSVIGRALNRDHTTVIYGLKQLPAAMNDPEVAALVRAVEAA